MDLPPGIEHTATPNLADKSTVANGPPNASWDIYYEIDLVAILILQEKVGISFYF